MSTATGDSMVVCSLCGQTYYAAAGHTCTWKNPNVWQPWQPTYGDTYRSLPMPGWECPRCHRIYSPTTPECHACNSAIDKAVSP
jgi:hypothetical protein